TSQKRTVWLSDSQDHCLGNLDPGPGGTQSCWIAEKLPNSPLKEKTPGSLIGPPQGQSRCNLHIIKNRKERTVEDRGEQVGDTKDRDDTKKGVEDGNVHEFDGGTSGDARIQSDESG
ncbi:unnamed protein product, partial [Choristocarpus tenellus]